MSPSRKPAHELVVAALLSVLAGVALVIGPRVPNAVPVAVLGALLTVAGVTVTIRSVAICRRSVRAGQGLSRVGSAVLGAGSVVAVVVSGSQLLAGARESRLDALGFFQTDPTGDVALAWTLFLLALLAFVAGEELVARRGDRGTGAATVAPSQQPRVDSKATYWVLLVTGLVLALLTSGESKELLFQERGRIQGEGALQLLTTALPLAITIAVTNRHWGSRWLVALNVALLALVVLPGGTRTPLVIIAVGLLLRLLQDTAWKPVRVRTALGLVAMAWIAATLLVALPEWRNNVRFGLETSIVSTAADAAANPFAQLWEMGGLDTLDGLILATKVDPDAVGASWTDPAKIVLGFIPHQVWADKPEWLGSTVTQYYTAFEAGGIFVSGPGYLLIVFGSKLGIALGFLFLGIVSEAVLRRFRTVSIWTVLVAYFVLRFSFGGDAFDGFHVLGLALVVLGAWAVGVAMSAVLRSPHPRTAPARGGG